MMIDVNDDKPRVFAIGRQTRDISEAASFGTLVEIDPHISIFHEDYCRELEHQLIEVHSFNYEVDYLLIAGYVAATSIAALIVQPERLLVFDNAKRCYKEKRFVYSEHALEG